jgi:uncharacterized protein (UPF0332 family)
MATTQLPDPRQSGIEDHVQMGRRFLEQAGIELDKGDRLQASEKVWGAVAHSLKAIGIQRGWVHDSHANVIAIGEHLAREFERDDFYDYVNTAESMHVNFYENLSEEDAVRRALDRAGIFIAELDKVRTSSPRVYTVRDVTDQRRLARLLGLPREERPAIGQRSEVGFSKTQSGA